MKYEEIIKEYEAKGKGEVVRIIKGLLSGEMENGMHAHVLDRENMQSKKDGVHRHLFILPNGTFVVTNTDGEHWHPLPKGSDWASADTSEHRHSVSLPDGETVTMEDGWHGHQLMMETSAFDGGHTHWLSLPEGQIIRSESAASLIEKFGVPPTPPIQFGGKSVIEKAKDYISKIFKKNDPEDNLVVKECKDLAPDKLLALASLGYEVNPKTIVEKAEQEKKKSKIAKKPQSTEVQTLIFPKGKFSLEQVKKFIKDNSFKMAKIDETGTSFRVRQKDPKTFVDNSFRTITLSKEKGVKAVVGRVRKEADLDFEELIECEIMKADEEKQIVFSVVLEPESDDDTQGDIMSVEEIEKSAHFFMKNSRVIGFRHVKKADAEVVESYTAPANFKMGGQSVVKGSWIIGIHISDPQLWAQIKSGELQAVSVGGFGLRTEEE